MSPVGSRGPGRPPAANGADTRRRIIRAAREVFGDRGYDATLELIAGRADLTRSAINHYFPSKKALFREVLAETTALMVAGGVERGRAETTLLGQLSAFMGVSVEAAAADPAVAPFMVTAMVEAHRQPGLAGADQDPLQQLRSFLAEIVDAAIERGELVTENAVGSVVELLVATLWGLAFYGAFLGDQQQLEAVTAAFEKLLASRLQ